MKALTAKQFLSTLSAFQTKKLNLKMFNASPGIQAWKVN
jgi:hypothetical protein